MRNLWLLFGVMWLVACGGPTRKITPPPPVALPPPPPYVVASVPNLGVLGADDTAVYWHDGEAFYRRDHGPDHPFERLYVTSDWFTLFAVGRDDLYFVDGSYRLRALPKAGGAPSDLAAGLDQQPMAIAADGDGVVVALADRLGRYSREPGERAYPLPGAPMTLAVADGIAYATLGGEDLSLLVAVDLATGEVTTVSDRPSMRDALALAVTDDQVIVMIADGVLAVPRTGGTPQLALSATPFALAADDAGYAVAASQVIVSHRAGQAPRVIAHGSNAQTLPSAYLIAVGGAYAYYASYDNQTGEAMLQAAPREVGASLMRLPRDAVVTATGSHGDRLYVAVERGDARTQIVEVTERKTRVIVDPAPGYIDLISASADHLMVGVGGALYQVVRDSGDTAVIAELAYLAPPVAHKGNVFWSQEAQVWARSLPPTRDPVLVADALRLGDQVATDLRLFELGFAADHLYFVVNLGEVQGLARADESHRVEWAWKWPRVDEGIYLNSGLVIVGGDVLVHDGEKVYRIPLAGGAATTALEIAGADDESATAPREIVRLFAAGEHLVVHTRGYGGEQLREVPRDGASRVLWEFVSDYSQLITAGTDAVYLYQPDLASILRIPVGSPAPADRQAR